MNANKLKGKLVEKNIGYQKIAEMIGISKVTFSNKVNGKTARGFSASEASKISEILDLSGEESLEIFFNNKLDRE